MSRRKLHGSAHSVSTMRVLSCLYEKELDFEFIPIDVKSLAHKKEPFLSMNPFGQIPVMEDGDLTIFESRAITRHVAREYQKEGTQLVYLNEGSKKTTHSMWMEVESQQFDRHAAKVAFELVSKPLLGMGSTDEAAVAEHQAELSKVLDVYEKRLGDSRYLSGDNFKLADLHHQPILHYLMRSPARKLVEERPNVARWVEELLGRPAWGKVVTTDRVKHP